MARRTLSELYGRFVARTDGLVRKLNAPVNNDRTYQEMCDLVHMDGRAFLVVRLHHLWGEFCRVLVVKSAFGQCKTLNGKLLSPVPNISTSRDIERKTKKQLVGPRATWHDPAFAVSIAQALTVSNSNEISKGLGSANTLHLHSVRNYLVHPNERTVVGFVQCTINLGFIGVNADELLTSLLPGGITVFETWVEDLRIAAFNAVQ